MQMLENYAAALISRVFSFLDWGLAFAVRYMWVIALVVALKAAKGVFRLSISK